MSTKTTEAGMMYGPNLDSRGRYKLPRGFVAVMVRNVQGLRTGAGETIHLPRNWRKAGIDAMCGYYSCLNGDYSSPLIPCVFGGFVPAAPVSQV